MWSESSKKSSTFALIFLASSWLVAACSFPDRTFDDEQFCKLTKCSNSGGTAGSGGSGAEGGSSGAAGTAGTGGTGAVGGGGTAGTGGSTAGTGGSTGGSGGTGATGGTGGTGATGGTGGMSNNECTSTLQCNDAQICSSYIEMDGMFKTFCKDKTVPGGGRNAPCSAGTDCESGYCDANDKVCTDFCRADSDCGTDTAVDQCLAVDVTDQAGGCRKVCITDADCIAAGAGMDSLKCIPIGDLIDNVWVGSCGKPIGTVEFPNFLTGNLNCTVGFVITATNPSSGTMEDFCSKACETSADCAASDVMKFCKSITLSPHPDGTAGGAPVQGTKWCLPF